MNAEEILKQAKASPDKRGLEAYLETMLELRRKDYSYRDIADFLIKHGVATDHTAVFRLLARENPLLDYEDGSLFIGGIEYESREGRPLRSFGAGLLITVEKKIQVIPLETPKKVDSTWCEYQYELNNVPNQVWLQRLCEALFFKWNPKRPHHLQGPKNFSLKFEGKVMALMCHSFNLDHHVVELSDAIVKTNQFFMHDKELIARYQKARRERDTNILESSVLGANDTPEEVIEDALKRYSDHADRLRKKFDKSKLP